MAQPSHGRLRQVTPFGHGPLVVLLDDHGGGVISAAIAVLVMAFLGVLMWQLFKDTLTDANTNVNDQLDQIK